MTLKVDAAQMGHERFSHSPTSLDRPVLAMSIAQASRATSLGRDKIYEAINSGELRAKKHGQRTVIVVSDLMAYLHDLPDYLEDRV